MNHSTKARLVISPFEEKEIKDVAVCAPIGELHWISVIVPQFDAVFLGQILFLLY